MSQPDQVINSAVSVDDESTVLAPARANARMFIILTNSGSDDCYVCFGSTASPAGVFLKGNGGSLGFEKDYQGALSAVCGEGESTTVCVAEGIDL